MTSKHRRFIEEFLTDHNGTQAYIRAGYSRGGASVQACRLLAKPKIAAAIAAAEEARAKRVGINQDRVERELAILAFSDVTHYLVQPDGTIGLSPEAPEGALRAVSSIKKRVTTRGSGEAREVLHEVELKLWDKPGPLQLAGQHVGMFKPLGDKDRPFHGVTTVKFGGRYRESPARAALTEGETPA